MREFDLQLLRLKEVLAVTEDQQVADLLGMSKHAFSDRKRRGSFPGEKVQALQSSRPDLKLDATYVLTGRSPERDARQAAINHQHYLDVQLDAERYMEESGIGEISNQEYRLAVLGGKFLKLDEQGRTAIENMIDLLLAKK